ncbi:MAG: hypothetical protein DHS20C15_29130 [Planctomycetota bacterium]|nr:MAG: hypothetical protein DHS20C15_29130 [Planctomycetota bacterium]
MTTYPLHTAETAPRASRPILEGAEKALGFVPNLYATMADAPAALQTYTDISTSFDSTSLSPLERQVVLIAASVENNCTYCVAAHSTIAGMQKLDTSVVDALRNAEDPADPKLAALAHFTRVVVEQRGFAGQEEVDRFLDAGYTTGQVLEVVLGVTMKTLSNYTSHLAAQPLDAAFEPQRWERPALAG